jgi:hypothetical protein
MIKSEYKYFGATSLIFLLSIAMLATLFKKYALLTFQHFVETCQQLVATFFSSGTHFIGLMLVALTFLVAVIFCAKALFSLIKTRKKINKLLAYKSNTIPKKLQSVLEKVKLERDKVVVIQKQSSYAFSYGVRSQKIVLSEELVRRLTSKQLEAVVLHELYHLENQHSLLLVLSEIISSTLFFLPLVKEINKKMKVKFEKQADAFTGIIQGNDSYLSEALLKVPSSRIYFYPNFAHRGNHKLSISSTLSSMLVSAFSLLLLLFPIQSHASQVAISPYAAEECREAQCATHCPTDNMSQEPTMSSNLQHNLTLVSY